jgi:hypothetical protein
MPGDLFLGINNLVSRKIRAKTAGFPGSLWLPDSDLSTSNSLQQPVFGQYLLAHNYITCYIYWHSSFESANR